MRLWGYSSGKCNTKSLPPRSLRSGRQTAQFCDLVKSSSSLGAMEVEGQGRMQGWLGASFLFLLRMHRCGTCPGWAFRESLRRMMVHEIVRVLSRTLFSPLQYLSCCLSWLRVLTVLSAPLEKNNNLSFCCYFQKQYC